MYHDIHAFKYQPEVVERPEFVRVLSLAEAVIIFLQMHLYFVVNQSLSLIFLKTQLLSLLFLKRTLYVFKHFCNSYVGFKFLPFFPNNGFQNG